MKSAKSTPTPNGVDREWPHQISLPQDDCGGDDYYRVHQFADTLSVCTRGHSYCHDGKWYRVFCFKERADAEKFQARFGGEWFDPARRGRGRKWVQLREPKKKVY